MNDLVNTLRDAGYAAWNRAPESSQLMRDIYHVYVVAGHHIWVPDPICMWPVPWVKNPRILVCIQHEGRTYWANRRTGKWEET